MNDYIFASMLLLAPVDHIEVPPPETRWPAISQAVQKVAVDWELLDKAECKYLMHELKDFNVDLKILKSRCVTLKDAPRAIEAMRFPDRIFCSGQLSFNAAYQGHMIIARDCSSDRDTYNDIIAEAKKLHTVWDAVRDSRCDYYHVTVRREALAKLRGLIGDEAFYSGELPPCVPVWRFKELP